MALRKFFQADIHEALVIEQQVHVAPWSLETFKTCFESGYLGWALEMDGRVAGFVIVSLRAEECHILNLCVARTHQHQGWGRKLLEEALGHATQKGAAIVYLEVRRTNSAAIALYRKMKFLEVGERKDYYPTPAGQEDALIFAKSLVKS